MADQPGAVNARVLKILRGLGATEAPNELGETPESAQPALPPEEPVGEAGDQDLSEAAKKARLKYGAFPRQRPE